MLRQLCYFAQLRLRLWFQRPAQFLLLIGILPLTMYFAASLLPSGVDSGRMLVAMVDHDESEYSKLVIERVSQHPLVQAVQMEEQEALPLIKQGQLEGAFIFKAGFMELVEQGKRQQVVELVHSPASLSIGIIRELIASEIIRLGSNAEAANYIREIYLNRQLVSSEEAEDVWQEAWEFSDSYWEPEPLMSIRYREFPLFPSMNKESSASPNPANDTADEPETPEYQANDNNSYFKRENGLLLFGWLATLLMLVAILLQQWLVEEKEQVLLQRVKGFTTSPAPYLLGNSLAILLFLLIELGVSLYILEWKLHLPVLSNGLVISLFVSYTLFCFSLAFLLALWAGTTAQLQGIGLSIVLLTSLFGGALFPLTEWTSIFHILSSWMPQEWLLQGLRSSLIYGQATTQAWLAHLLFSLLVVVSGLINVWRWRKV